LENLLTDSLFAKRDRMGRTLGFLAPQYLRRMVEVSARSCDWRKIGRTGRGRWQANGGGTGKGAYFLRPTRPPEVCKEGQPFIFREISVYRVAPGGHFDVTSWKGDRPSPPFAGARGSHQGPAISYKDSPAALGADMHITAKRFAN